MTSFKFHIVGQCSKACYNNKIVIDCNNCNNRFFSRSSIHFITIEINIIPMDNNNSILFLQQS